MIFHDHATPDDAFVLIDIGAIRIEFLASVMTIDQGFKFLGIMNRSIGYGVGSDVPLLAFTSFFSSRVL